MTEKEKVPAVPWDYSPEAHQRRRNETLAKIWGGKIPAGGKLVIEVGDIRLTHEEPKQPDMINNLTGTRFPELLGKGMSTEDFGEFYNTNYREMPSDFYPEITWETDKFGKHWRKSSSFTYPCYSETDRAEMDNRLRRMEWDKLEMERIKALAGIS